MNKAAGTETWCFYGERCGEDHTIEQEHNTQSNPIAEPVRKCETCGDEFVSSNSEAPTPAMFCSTGCQRIF